jgi:hypothetical protein
VYTSDAFFATPRCVYYSICKSCALSVLVVARIFGIFPRLLHFCWAFSVPAIDEIAYKYSGGDRAKKKISGKALGAQAVLSQKTSVATKL